MTLVWIGALLLLGGLVLMAVQPLQRARLSGGRIRAKAAGTLEPPKPAAGFDIRSHWPGLALSALGALILLAAGIFGT